MTSVRFPRFWLFDGLRKQQSPVNRGFQAHQAYQTGSQMSNQNLVSNYNAMSVGVTQGFQRDVCNAIAEAKSGRPIEIYEGCMSASNSGNLVNYPGDNLANLNSFDFIRHQNPPSLKARFGRACRAFVNAWRAA